MQRLWAPVTLALAVLLWLAPCGAAAGPPSSSGRLAGVVTDARGAPQMGAAVALIAVDGRTLRQVYSDDRGAFLLEHLLPGIYSLRVTLASFLPALKGNILVEPGVNAFLAINLESLFTTIDMLRGRRRAPDRDDDWTWVLRSSAAHRPILRYGDTNDNSTPNLRAEVTYPSVLQFNGGAGRSSAIGSEADFNTSFTVANRLFENTRVLLSGNVGYERNTPATAFRVTMRRELASGATPEVSVTLRQIFLPGAFWEHVTGREENMQALSLSAGNHYRLGQNLRLEYGFLYESITFLSRLNSVSPFGRVIYESGPSTVALTYSEGAPRPHLEGNDPFSDVATQLAVFPRLSLRGGQPAVQRGQHVEVSFAQKLAPQTTAQVGVFRDDIHNLALNSISGGESMLDFFPDVFTQHYSYNAGNFKNGGVRAAIKQNFSEHLQATLAYSYAGVLMPERNFLLTQDPDELRRIMRMQKRQALATKLAADVPVTKTRVYATYKWIFGGAVLPGDIYDESLAQTDSNFNLVIRQPLPSFVILPGRVEALADFRNLLAQGYVPVITADGKRLMLVQNVRSFRGGFSFTF
jgi:hypothetical protein